MQKIKDWFNDLFTKYSKHLIIGGVSTNLALKQEDQSAKAIKELHKLTQDKIQPSQEDIDKVARIFKSKFIKTFSIGFALIFANTLVYLKVPPPRGPICSAIFSVFTIITCLGYTFKSSMNNSHDIFLKYIREMKQKQQENESSMK